MKLIRQYYPHFILAIGVIIILLPFYWMILSSIRPPEQIFDTSLWPIPKKFFFIENYGDVLKSIPIIRFILNGVIVCFCILLVQILTSVPAAYALAKLDFPGKKLLWFFVISALCVPIQTLALPLFMALAKLKLLNTYFALTFPFFLSAFAIFLFRQSFKSYPDEIIEAARMDGFTEIEICWKLVFRASLPSVAAFSVFSIVAHWNDLYWPMVVISESKFATPPLGMLLFSDAETGANYGALMAAATIITAPIVLCFLFARRYFISGVTMSGMK